MKSLKLAPLMAALLLMTGTVAFADHHGEKKRVSAPVPMLRNSKIIFAI